MRYLRICIVLCMLIPGSSLYAQENLSNEELLGTAYRINIIPLEIEIELPLRENITLKSSAGLYYSFGSGIPGSGFVIEANPYLNVFPRYYYNLDKRKAAGRDIAGYSGNYLGLYSVFQLNSFGKSDLIANPNRFLSGPVWGLQRNIKGVANLDLFLGWGFGWGFEGSNFIMKPVGGLKIGFFLNTTDR